ncbi:nitrate ABC transporter permease [Blautia wexlerae]|nr:nitrate ABC transporter permease [Blautia wexlerae]RHS70071.1 nitrate ABC transporter permease [Ruminococcus sp. AM44-9AT]NSF30832.1 nitrate ABC transporter permease [Blautia wexlerae]NSF34479.1 nitrate ABC transporter permease [Blautia wexlerae]NSF55238.1 nitrate ABC transporter permease [Blautia wexlerae]
MKKGCYTGIRIVAVFFWITIWQFASMYLGQEILLASPVSVVRKLFELSFTGNFWQSVGFSFVHIVTGFLLAMFLGIFLAVLAYWSKTVEILIAPVIAVVKSTPVASFIILCLIWIPSRNLSVFISFLMVLPYFLSACRLSLGMCWKAGVAAEVIGVPSGSIGEKLYNAKIYLNTPDLFAWTIVIIVISFVFEKCFLGIVSRVVYMIEHK